MLVAVMQVRIMRMAVRERLVAVPVGVRLTRGIVRAVRVLVVLVVDVAVRVLERRVVVLVLVPLAQMQVQADRHQDAGEHQAP